MPAPWTKVPVLSIDCESTGVDPFTARVVELAAVEVAPNGTTRADWSTIVDPGVEIPEGAIDVHGITNERAKAEGVEPAEALAYLADRVWQYSIAYAGHGALVVFNARYDLPLLISECARHGITWPPYAGIVDPLVIDKACDHWRKDEIHHRPVAHTHAGGFEQAREHRRGRRKLVILADRYDVALTEEDAHGALADATAAGRILWRIVDRFPKVAEHSLSTLWQKQVQQAARQRDGLQDWIRQNRDPSCDLVGGWPIPERAERDDEPARPTLTTAGATA
jgi:DNA polymerase-3 subunit epsilon